MAYHKIIVDNPVCMRRFHIACDDEREIAPRQVDLRCPHCHVVIFTAAEHTAAQFLREENLTKVTTFSSHLLNECQLQDKFHRPPRDN